MAKGRMVSQSVATDKRLNELSIEAEYLFLKTIPHLDRDGLITGEAFMLLAKVCPRRQDFIPRMADLIREWVDAELVMTYETDEGDALYFYGFTKNQTGLRYDREAPSMYAPPPGYERTDTGLVPASSEDEGQQDNGGDRGTLPTESADDSRTCEPTPAELRQNSGEEGSKSASTDDISEKTGDLHECGQHPAELRQNSGTLPDVVPPKYKYKFKFKYNNNTTPAREDSPEPEENVVVGVPSESETATDADVFAAYQDNFGSLTPMIAEQIGDDCERYTAQWVLDAMQVAVRQESRRLAYVEGILKRWHRDGRGDGQRPSCTAHAAGGMGDIPWSTLMEQMNRDTPEYMQ